jgi:DNA-binding transcriptional LysR family regulator
MELINISADDYILFVAIVEQESMVRAAEHLGMPKATVSRRLTNLEAALGQRLLIRTTRRLTLTDFGAEFLEHCRRVAEEVAATRDFVSSQEEKPRGRLRVSMPGEYAKQHTPAISTFIEAHPDIQLDLDLTSRRVDLIGERYDLAIRMGTLDDDSALAARKIDEQHIGLYASPIYLALRPAPNHPSDLQRHIAVRLMTARGAPAVWKLLHEKSTWEGTPPGRITLNSMDVIKQLLLEGAGIGALPDRYAEEDVHKKRLVRVLPAWCLPPVPAWAVTPTRRYLPAKTRAFLAHLEEFIGKAR